MNASIPDDIRADGWTVAVHNDYRYGGEMYTFWLFTRPRDDGGRTGYSVSGEGRTDAEALNMIRSQIALPVLEDQ